MAEPLTAALLGVLLLGERMNLTGAAGVVLLFSGVGLLALRSRKG
jgi:DME family drug/metabolite transporter